MKNIDKIEENKIIKRSYLPCIFILVISLLILFIIFCSLMYQLVAYKCVWWECAPKRDFTVYDLNLPDDFFPPNSETHPLHPDRLAVSIDEAVTTNYWEHGRAVYSVLQFSTEEEAKKWFNYEVNTPRFTSEIDDLPPFKPILEYKSSIANEHKVFCGYITSDLQCDFGARYQEFYVFFSASMGDGEMNEDDFISVMEYVDLRMKELLYNSIP